MRILGVDPGLRVTGYGAIETGPDGARLIEAGFVGPDPQLALERRLAELYEGMCAVLVAVEPDVMVIEELWTGYRNPTTAVLMGHARGVLCLAAGTHGIGVRHLGHSLVKRALAGSGTARKEQVKRMVMQQLRLVVRPAPDDVSDALALALALANIERAERAFARAGARAI
ncbi:MAG: crossover junction endodeoxyribonuclease RuvC [Candidatus Baltobacteraceae bacterium]